jgi:parallel beta-helix repeat protein
MKRTSRCGLVLLFLLAATLLGSSLDLHTDVPASQDRHQSHKPALLHEPILIDGDADLVSQGWPGSGTPEDPYTIEGLDITHTAGHAIEIVNTHLNILITDCTLSSWSHSYAIKAETSQNIAVEGCIFSNGGLFFDRSNHSSARTCSFDITDSTSVRIENSSECSIEENTLSGPAEIDVLSSYRCRVASNVIEDSGFGLLVFSSSECVVTGNQIQAVDIPIHLRYSDSCTVHENQVSGGVYGLVVFKSNNTSIHDNAFTDSGLLFPPWDITFDSLQEDEVYNPATLNLSVEGNTVNQYPLAFLRDLGEVALSSLQYGQVVMMNCQGTAIQGAHLEPAPVSIQVINSSSCQIMDCTISNASIWGILGFMAQGLHVVTSEISHCGVDGLFFLDSPETQVSESEVYLNGGDGIHLWGSDHSIISENGIYQNGEGVWLQDSDFCSLINNSLMDNSAYGVRLTAYSANNTIYGNAFGWNEDGNARDWNGTLNQWDNGIDQGNAWHDYEGSGVYEIPAAGVDRYPKKFYFDLLLYDPTAEILIGIIVIVSAVAVVYRRKRRNQKPLQSL